MKLPIKKKQSTEILSLRVSTEMKKNIERIALDNVSTPSEVVRYAIKNLVTTH